ncbi:MAG: hypothetical protein NXI31_17675 [bacterium]|nr:hypothetical protein [bacterium]
MTRPTYRTAPLLLLLASCGAPDGNRFVLFDNAYDTPGNEESSALAVAPNGELLIVGKAKNDFGEPTTEDLTFVRVAKDGQQIAARTTDLGNLLAPPKLEETICVGHRAAGFVAYGSLHTPGERDSTRAFRLRGDLTADKPATDVGALPVLSSYDGLVHDDGAWIFGCWSGDDGYRVHALHFASDLTAPTEILHEHPGKNAYVGGTGQLRADGSILLAVSYGERHGSVDSQHEIVHFKLGQEPRAITLGAIAEVALTGIAELPNGNLLCTASIGPFRDRRGLLIGCDKGGAIQWQKEVSLGKETVISGVGSIGDRGWLIGGSAYDGNNDAASAWAARVSTNGELAWIWQRRRHGTLGNPPTVAVAGDRGYLLTQALRNDSPDLNLIAFDLSK